MSDPQNDTTSQETIKIRDLSFPILNDFNFVQKMAWSIPHAPIIGHTPEKQPQRWFWSRVCRVGHFLNDHLARFEYHEADNDYDGPEEYWLKKDWRWLESAGERSKAAMPQPIYDPDWVMPESARTVTWGYGSPPTVDPDVLGIDTDGNEVRRP